MNIHYSAHGAEHFYPIVATASGNYVEKHNLGINNYNRSICMRDHPKDCEVLLCWGRLYIFGELQEGLRWLETGECQHA